MKIWNKFLRLIVLLSLILGALAAPIKPVLAAATDQNIISKGTSPEPYLNSDGTLNLDKKFSGSFDLSGWDVQLDSAHGPVFSPISTQDNWSAVGSASAFEQTVFSVVVNGTDVYVGGAFRDLDSIPEADHIARWDGTKWNALSSNGSGNGAISANEVDTLAFSNGILYVGGTFLNVKNTSNVNIASNFAQWDGNSWSAVGNLTTLTGNNSVYTIAFYNDLIYIGGGFTDLNTIPEADYVASYNITTATWSSLGDNGAGVSSITSFVKAIAVDSLNGDVYVGGSFTDADGIAAADRIAKWNGTTWSPLGNGINNNSVDSILVSSPTEIYVGGTFTNVDSIATADYIAKWDGSVWSALGSYSGDGAMNMSGISYPGVRSMLLDSGILYVGGGFNMSQPNLAAGKYLAQYTIATEEWSVVDDDGSGGSPLAMPITYGLNSIALSAGELYLGGYQTGFNDNGTIQPKADFFSSVNITSHTWSTYGIDNGVFQRNPVTAIAAIGTDVYVAGYFQQADRDLRMNYLIRWDGSVWNPVGNLNQYSPSINNRVYALAVDGTDLYAGGIFTSVANEGVTVPGTSRIAKLDTLTNTWSALGTGIPNNSVSVLAVDSSHNVYAGGDFTDVNAIAEADYIAKWNGSTWSALAGNGSGAGALNGMVNAIAFNGSIVYVGGAFTSVKNTSDAAISNAAYLAQWDGSVWSAIPGTTSPFTSTVRALVYADGNLYTGGNFSSANGVVGANAIAVWNSVTQIWSAMGNNPFTNYVTSISIDGANIYVGGNFTNAAGILTADYIAKWNGTNWSSLGSDGAGNGSLNAVVNNLAVIQNDLWVGGDFLNVNNNSTKLNAADKLAVFGLDLPPTVSSITRASANPTSAASVDFIVTFSETVQNVDINDFSLDAPSITGASITSVNGSGTTRTITVNTGTGSGAIRLDVLDTATIQDTAGAPLSNLPFTSGEVYTKTITTTILSTATQDGQILETTETSGKGGSIDSTATRINLGDDAANKQYRAILSFDTSSLPDNAVITSVTLKVKYAGKVGTLPFSTHGNLMADIRKGSFSNNATLQANDFKAGASKNNVLAFTNSMVSNWFSQSLAPANFQYVNLTNVTQFRLRFQTDDNHDFGADLLKIFSSNAGASGRPKLIIEYYVP